LLQKRTTRWSERVFVAEGLELLRTALEAGQPVESVYVAPEGVADAAIQKECSRATGAGARVFPLAPGVLERVADTVTPQPVLSILSMMDDPSGAAALHPSSHPLVVVMVDVRDPGNAGTVLRTADASGASSVVFSAESVDPYNPKTVRASAGSIFHVPFCVEPDALALASSLAERGYRTVATVVGDGTDYTAVDWTQPTAVFLGNESAGLGSDLLGTMQGTVVIPMEGSAESLNVGVACAVLCFEALRQRRLAAAR